MTSVLEMEEKRFCKERKLTQPERDSVECSVSYTCRYSYAPRADWNLNRWRQNLHPETTAHTTHKYYHFTSLILTSRRKG